MPWNEPGRGSGGGGKDPWKGGGNGQQPPDLDEVFANVQRRLKSIMGGGDGGGRSSSGGGGPALGGVFGLILVAVVLWVVWDSIHIIDESERGVVLRFGEYSRVLDPGLNFTFPRPIESLEKVNVTRVRSLDNQSRILTGDENLIDVNFAIQYRVIEPEKFLFNVRTPENSLAHATDSAIREIVGTNNMDFILEVGRGQVARDAGDLVQDIVDRYDSGIQVTSFNLQDVRPPMQVQEAFDDVVRAREDQIRFANEAQAYANQEIPEARGRAARIMEEGEAYRESTIAQATGEADRFTAVLEEFSLAPEVSRQRLYLQTMEEVLSATSKVMLDIEQGGNILYLPLDRMTGGGNSRNMPPPPLMTPRESDPGTAQVDPRARRGREGR